MKLKGILISAAGVRSVWLCNDLENFQKRLKALEAKVNQEGIILTKEQIAALEKIKETKETHGEIETQDLGDIAQNNVTTKFATALQEYGFMLDIYICCVNFCKSKFAII